ncbi:MAG: serine/threonine protein kinase [Bacteroidaceae bacterium]|nr:serine/threonine protein kinase [Bacteroidaceae bacterium]
MEATALNKALPIGTLIGERYRIKKFINSGGFGNTYQAIDTNMTDEEEDDTFVVVKEFYMKDICERDPQTFRVNVPNTLQRKNFDALRRKFVSEAKRIYRLKHPGIVRVTDIIKDENNTSYYIMNYISGGSLSQLLKRRGTPLPEAEALDYIEQVLKALAFVHKKKMLHLDIKPANIMLEADGHPVLIDFGASKVISDDGTGESSSAPMVYTKGYAPLEQQANDLQNIRPSTDLYAVGATLYRLLTNHEPPNVTDIDNADSPEEVFKFPDSVSQHTRTLVVSLMKRRQKDRPASANAVLDYLHENSDESVIVTGREVPDDFDWYNNNFGVDETEIVTGPSSGNSSGNFWNTNSGNSRSSRNSGGNSRGGMRAPSREVPPLTPGKAVDTKRSYTGYIIAAVLVGIVLGVLFFVNNANDDHSYSLEEEIQDTTAFSTDEDSVETAIYPADSAAVEDDYDQVAAPVDPSYTNSTPSTTSQRTTTAPATSTATPSRTQATTPSRATSSGATTSSASAPRASRPSSTPTPSAPQTTSRRSGSLDLSGDYNPSSSSSRSSSSSSSRGSTSPQRSSGGSLDL